MTISLKQQIEEGKGYNQSLIERVDGTHFYRVIECAGGNKKGTIKYKGEIRLVRYDDGVWYLF